MLRLIRGSFAFVAVLFCFTVATASSDISRSFAAKVDRFVYGPDGKPSGMVLDDHSFLQFNSASIVNARVVAPGDLIYVRGEEVLSKPNRVFENVLIRKGVDTVVDDTTPKPPGLAPLEPITYKSTYDTSALLSVGVGPDRQIDRLVLRDGTYIKIPKGGYVQRNQISLGQRIYVQGVGTTTGGVKYIEATNVQGPNQRPVLGAAGESGEKWADRDGKIKQLLLTPSGNVDGVLLTDDSAVRFEPVPADRVPDLKPGVSVKVAGASVEDQLHAGLLYLPDQERVVDFGQILRFGPHAREQAGEAATRLEDTSEVQTFLRTPHGEVETIVLKDGTTVKVPPQMQSVASTLKQGQTVTVRGVGGKYLEGTAITADSIVFKA